MIHKSYVPVLLVVLFAFSAPCLSQLQEPTPENWAVYVAGDCNIHPNITYAIANNTELKLDLYLPKNRSVPVPTLILFHGSTVSFYSLQNSWRK